MLAFIEKNTYGSVFEQERNNSFWYLGITSFAELFLLFCLQSSIDENLVNVVSQISLFGNHNNQITLLFDKINISYNMHFLVPFNELLKHPEIWGFSKKINWCKFWIKQPARFV